MSTNTSIEWADHTFNPWWGCQRVSPGCERCYAETFANRLGRKVWGPTVTRSEASEKVWRDPAKWNAAAAKHGIRQRVFCASMADVFEDRPEVAEARLRLWTVIERTPNLDWLLLTKRPENVASLVPWAGAWPTNVWLGTTAEDQRRADERLPHLLNSPASVRFVSAEPLLSAVDLSAYLHGVDWVLLGGESGNGSRKMEIEWARSVRDQCRAADVRLHFKQWGNWAPSPEGGLVRLRSKSAGGRELDGVVWNELPQPTMRIRTRFERI